MTSGIQVFILSHNRATWLRECVQSFLRQTHLDFQLVVLDNASEDDTAAALRDIHDDRVTYVRKTVNDGAGGNFITACQMADREYMMIFHDDDCAHPTLLEHQTDVLREVPDAVCVMTNCAIVRDHSLMGVHGGVREAEYATFRDDADLFRAGLNREGRCIGFGGTLYRTNVVKQSLSLLGPLSRRFFLTADRVWLLSLAAQGRSAFLEAPHYNVRFHGGQDSQRLNSEYRYSLEYIRYVGATYYRQMDREQYEEWEASVVVCLLSALAWHLSHRIAASPQVLRDIVTQRLIPARRLLALSCLLCFRYLRGVVRRAFRPRVMRRPRRAGRQK